MSNSYGENERNRDLKPLSGARWSGFLRHGEEAASEIYHRLLSGKEEG